MIRIGTRIGLLLILGFVLGLPALARAADPRPGAAAAPAGTMDCGGMQKALEDARAKRDAVGKADLSPCAGKKGPDRTRCLTTQRDGAKAGVEAARQKVTQARKALSCCKNPRGKSCSGG
jgi:hypothetical protein